MLQKIEEKNLAWKQDIYHKMIKYRYVYQQDYFVL